MLDKLKKYRAIGVAIAVVLVLTALFSYLDFVRINPTAITENTIIFSLWVSFLSLVFYRIDHSGRRWELVGKLASLLVSFILIISIDQQMDMPDNPLTLCISVLLWVYLVYLIAPKFIWKYRLLIVGIYGPACLYFIYNRYFNVDYLEIRDQIIPAFFLPIPIFIIVWLYEQWKWFQSLKADKAQAELALLKSQINPHFFFNTLNNLYSLSVNNSDQAPAVILKLSKMMRYTIYEGKKEQVKLEDELTYVQNFLELHKIRHKAAVDITFRQNITSGFLISPLLFINLVENAFKHGAERMTENAFIHIKATAMDGTIIFSIRNNFDPEERTAETGIGIENLQKRLNLLYPDQHSLTINEQDDQYFCELKIIGQ